MELKHCASILKRWWWLMAACVAVAAGSSLYGTTQMSRIYQATTTVMVGQTLEQVNPNSTDLYVSKQLAQTYAELVKRRPILESAAEALGLSYALSPSDISAQQVAGTQLLEVSVRDTDPERARAVADEIAHQLILNSPATQEDQERQTFVGEQLADLQAKIEASESAIEDEREKLEAANSARSIQQYQANINALEQKLGTYQSTYASLISGIRGGTNYISIVEPATTPLEPISPNVEQTVLLAAAIGLTLAVGGAFLIEYLDDTIKTSEDVDSTVDLPTLGAIARITGEDYPEKLIAVREPRSPTVEAYRALRTNIQFSSIDRPTQALMVTSASPGEGKSMTLANLAVVMAQSGLKVVAVDSDLRRPVLHRIFGVPDTPGLGDAILNTTSDRSTARPIRFSRATHSSESLPVDRDDHGMDTMPVAGVEACLRPTDVDNLWLLPSGPLPPNPADLLGSERMAHLVHELKTRADVILFDSPPVLAVTDAPVLATRVDGVVLVFESGLTRREAAKRSVEKLRRVRAHLLGVVLNNSPGRQKGRYYPTYYPSEVDAREKRPGGRQWSWLRRLIPSGGNTSEGASRGGPPGTEPRIGKDEIDDDRHKPRAESLR